MKNHIKYSKGICWIGDCRIPTTELLGREQKSSHNYAMLQGGYNDGFWDNTKGLGRFTPNLLVCDDMLNDGSITSIKQNKDYIPPNEPDSIVGFSRGKYSGINDKGTNSRYYDLDKWFDKVIDNL
jgi:hypothetical protein